MEGFIICITTYDRITLRLLRDEGILCWDMSNKKNDNYIDNYFDDEEIAPVVTNRALLEPLICGGFAVLVIILYFFILTGRNPNDRIVIFIVPFFAFRGLVISLGNLKDRFSHIVYWRLGFYSCAVSLAVFLVIFLTLVKMYL